MEPVTAYLGLGTNLGNRLNNLSQALHCLTISPAVQFVRSSSMYETAPWGYTDQPSFLNCAVEIRTRLSPADLLDRAKNIERGRGRQENFRYGPRIIDIDILLYGDHTINLRHPDLQIPHRLMAERAFVLVPLSEIAPEMVHPALDIPLNRLLEKVEGREGVKLWGPPITGLEHLHPGLG